MAKSVFKKITEWIMEAAEKPPKNLPETPEPYEDDPDNPIKQKLDGLLAKAEQVDEATDPIDWVVRVVEWRSELLALATALYKVPTGDPDTHPDAVKWALDAIVIRVLQKKSAELTTALGAVGIIQIEPDPIHEGQTRHIFDYDKLFSLIADPASTFAAPDRPSAIAYDPTGTRLVQSSADYHIRIWDLGGSTSDPIKDLRGHPGRINDVAFSPDGRHIASAADDHTARIWDADPAGSNDQLHVLDKHFLSVWSVAWNHEGTKLASGSSDRTVRTWTSNGGEGHRLVGHEGKVFSVAYNPAGNRIVSASADRTVRVWNASAADPALLVLRGHAGPVWSAAFNHDATRIVSAGEDGTVRTWNATTGEQERVFEGHTGRVFSAAFSHDGVEIVSAGEDQTVRIWNANDEAQQPIVLEEHQSRVWSAAFRPGDRTQLASASQDKLVLTWETGGPGNPVTYGMAEDVIGQPPEVFAAVAVLAPTLGASLLAGDVTVADLVPPLAADSATPWGSFRAAAGQWLSATIPEIGKKEDGNGDRPYPENLFEIASGARARLQRHLGGARQPLHGAGRGGCQGFRDLAPLHAGTRRVGVRAA